MMSLKNIKVTEEVKHELDDYALEKETYNVTIQRLIRENISLKERCEELKQDKELFMEINRMKKRPTRHNAIFESDDIKLLIKEGITEFYRQEYKNDADGNYSSTPLELVGFINMLNALYELDVDYEGDYDKQKLFDLIDALNDCIYRYKDKDYRDSPSYEESLYDILKCDYRDYDVKDDLLKYLKE